MIRYLKHNEIDKSAWDKCIDASTQSLIYAKSFFLDIVSPGWEALVAENYEAVFPLTHRKKYGICYLFQPPYTQQLGLFSCNEIFNVGEFLEKIPSHFRQVEINLNENNFLKNHSGFTVNKRITHLLNLNKSHSDLFSSYSENTKRNIRKFASRGLKVNYPDDIGSLIKLFGENRGKQIRKKQDDQSMILYRLYDELNQRKLTSILNVADEDGNYIGGALFVRSAHRHIFLYSGVSETGRSLSVMHSIIDHYIKQYSGTDAVLDFEGSMNPNLARFYKSFGSNEVVYLQLIKNRLPPVIRWLKKS